jgi:hypothetical protein
MQEEESMQLVRGDLWDAYGVADLVLFAANSQLDKNDCLVMGAGSALEAKQRFPHLPAEIGEWLIEEGEDGREFYLWVPGEQPRQRPRGTVVGAIQTKRFWRDPSDLALIDMSICYLWRFLDDRPEWRVAMPLLGCGPKTGQLRRENVLPLLACLPDSVHVYER